MGPLSFLSYVLLNKSPDGRYAVPAERLVEEILGSVTTGPCNVKTATEEVLCVSFCCSLGAFWRLPRRILFIHFDAPVDLGDWEQSCTGTTELQWARKPLYLENSAKVFLFINHKCCASGLHSHRRMLFCLIIVLLCSFCLFSVFLAALFSPLYKLGGKTLICCSIGVF